MLKKVERFFQTNRVFVLLVAFRWLSLIPPLFTLGQNDSYLPPIASLALAVTANAIISTFNKQINDTVQSHPYILGVDLLFSSFIIAVSGGFHSPYFLYALSPLLAGAFFFQARGAIFTSLSYTVLHLVAGAASPAPPPASVAMQIGIIWLFPLLFAYPATLLESINQTTNELTAAHRQLEIIHDLTVLLQAAPDLISVQERVLGAVTTELGFSKAVIAMVDPAHEEIGGWMVYPPDPTFPKTKPLPLKSESGEAAKALLNHANLISNHLPLTSDSQLDSWLKQNSWSVMPLYLREHPVGVLLTIESELTKERESTLMTVARQAALSLGTTILCIDRARRLAVETERNRIARDIHDTVAQSLFGIVYSLDACITMLPQQADDVKKELIDLRSLANNAHDEVRRSIFDLWPSALNIELFMADLSNYVAGCCRPRPFSIIFNNNGDFNSLSAGMRRAVYRMAQEAMANSARHSGEQTARLCMTITDKEVYLVASDDGKGFIPQTALSRSQNREHFGLHGIQERARAMGGDCEIISQPNAGTRIMINLPIHGHKHG